MIMIIGTFFNVGSLGCQLFRYALPDLPRITRNSLLVDRKKIEISHCLLTFFFDIHQIKYILINLTNSYLIISTQI